MNNWTLDKTKAASVGESNYIKGNTNDTFQINSAAWLANEKKDGSPTTFYLKLNIMNRHKSTADIDIYYGNSNGERWSGESLIHAIMLCANVPELSQAQGKFKAYDFDAKKELEFNGTVAPELAGKKIGMFLSENWYVKQATGEVKRGGLNLFSVYDSQTNQLPKEKANNEPANPEAFQKVVEAMIKASSKSEDDAKNQAGMNQAIQQQQQFGQQQQQANQPVTYQRGPAPQQQQPQQQFNNQMTGQPTAGGPPDDDIPFAPAFGG